jgi:apolipoprotein N-acyltransferase
MSALAIAQLSGWRRNSVAFICGIMATLTLPPFFIVPLIIPAFTGLYLLLHGAPNSRRAFKDGWWWGWGFYITGLYWFCIALLTEPEKFAWAIPFALFGLTGVIAIYTGVAAWLTYKVPARGMRKIFIFTLIWTLVEFARGHLFTGFPWNLAGYAFAVTDASLQLASVIGAYGLTWFAVMLGAIPAAIVLGHRRSISVAAICYALLFIAYGWGVWRLQEADHLPDSVRYRDAMVRLVQANIAQHHKWDPKKQFDGLQKYIALTKMPVPDNVRYIIWPETAVPYAVKSNTPLTAALGNAIQKDTVLVTGALRMDAVSNDDWAIYNSLMVFDHTGQVTTQYDKHHLVPFGEFLPFRWLLPPEWLTPVGPKDFSIGSGAQTLQLDKELSVSPLICYEAIFPGAVIDKMHRPQLLLNITNDAWFGLSTGPYQHFEMARMRAVEEGIPLVRVANTGISAVIDGYGRVENSIPLGTEGVLDSRIPLPLAAKTLFSQW